MIALLFITNNILHLIFLKEKVFSISKSFCCSKIYITQKGSQLLTYKVIFLRENKDIIRDHGK